MHTIAPKPSVSHKRTNIHTGMHTRIHTHTRTHTHTHVRKRKRKRERERCPTHLGPGRPLHGPLSEVNESFVYEQRQLDRIDQRARQTPEA